MPIKPIQIDSRYGFVIGFLILITAAIGTLAKWKEFYEFIAPGGVLLNWRFFLITLLISMSIVWFIMNQVWQREYNAHEITKKDRDNLKDELKISENERLTDVVTGVPNSRGLERDIEKYYSKVEHNKKMQFIFIDLKGFRKINEKFSFNKTNDLLRTIAQTIYKRMRRNEDMYKYSDDNAKTGHGNETFYRVYSGGDEFVFIIEGDQSDALGFSNRLVSQFEQLSGKTRMILGEDVTLSFHCSVVEMDARDTLEDLFNKAKACNSIAKEGKRDFTICWHPTNIESVLSKDSKKKAEYERTWKLFDVMTIFDKDY